MRSGAPPRSGNASGYRTGMGRSHAPGSRLARLVVRIHTARASSVARVTSARVSSRSTVSRISRACSSPFAPAMLNHMCASMRSLSTPRPVVIHGPEVGLGAGVSLLRRQTVPLHGLGIVLRHALSGGVHEPEVVLGAGVTLLRRQTGPLQGLLVVWGTPRPVAYLAPRLAWASA